METQRKYKFSWELLGDLALGRPNLGPTMHIEVYRLMQFTIRDVLEQHYGGEAADSIFNEAGKLAGEEFQKHVIGESETLGENIRRLQVALRELGIGVLRIEQADAERGSFTMTVSEDLDCSGLPVLDYETCHYDEGFIAGLLETFTGKAFDVKEVDCWCTGDRTCRFVANVMA